MKSSLEALYNRIDRQGSATIDRCRCDPPSSSSSTCGSMPMTMTIDEDPYRHRHDRCRSIYPRDTLFGPTHSLFGPTGSGHVPPRSSPTLYVHTATRSTSRCNHIIVVNSPIPCPIVLNLAQFIVSEVCLNQQNQHLFHSPDLQPMVRVRGHRLRRSTRRLTKMRPFPCPMTPLIAIFGRYLTILSCLTVRIVLFLPPPAALMSLTTNLHSLPLTASQHKTGPVIRTSSSLLTTKLKFLALV